MSRHFAFRLQGLWCLTKLFTCIARSCDDSATAFADALASRLGTVETIDCQLAFDHVGTVAVCRILVPASPVPLYLDSDRLLIRAGTTSRHLPPAEMTPYVFRCCGAPA